MTKPRKPKATKATPAGPGPAPERIKHRQGSHALDSLGYPPAGVATPEQLLERRDKRRAILLPVFTAIADGELVIEATQRLAGIDPATMRAWIADDREFLSPLYASAKEEAADALVELAQQIAHGTDAVGVTMHEMAEAAAESIIDPEKRNRALNALESTRVQRDKLRVDTLKWTASKRRPRTYGDKLDLTSGNEKLEPAVVLMPPLDPRPQPGADAAWITEGGVARPAPAPVKPDLSAIVARVKGGK